MKRIMCAACGEPWDCGVAGCCGPCRPVEVEDVTLIAVSVEAKEDGSGVMQLEYADDRPVEDVRRGLLLTRNWIDQELSSLVESFRKSPELAILAPIAGLSIDSPPVN